MRARGSLVRLGWLVALALPLPSLAGCPQDEIRVRAGDPDEPGDNGRQALLEAGALMRQTPTSPEAFGVLYQRVEELRPWFTKETTELAERTLAFAAVPVMEAVATRPADEQARALALTVWSAAFRTAPFPGEDPDGFTRRLCGEILRTECGDIVPQYWTLILSQLAWRRFGERARAMFNHCPECRVDSGYRAALEILSRRNEELLVTRARLGDAVQHTSWPVAGEHAVAWTNPPLFQRTPPETFFDGAAIMGGTWAETLHDGRAGRTVLGVYVRPSERVEMVREIAGVAAAAGFTEIALLARAPAFPYDPREYRVGIGKRAKGPRVRVRDMETVQALVQALDATLARAERVRL
ncbi:MAG TPA: hypothetical protein VML75_21040 [Kofleriaceae bacterium]|nr:hypothetical protein [Kofleriaceae bacterium]